MLSSQSVLWIDPSKAFCLKKIGMAVENVAIPNGTVALDQEVLTKNLSSRATSGQISSAILDKF